MEGGRVKQWVLERFLPSGPDGANEHGTFGTLSLEGDPFTFFTVEDEWRANARAVSCIPSGVYPLRRTIYHKHGYPTYEVADVPDRERILVHPGNTEEDTMGCILPGLALGLVTVGRDEETGQAHAKKLAVLKSRAAFARFMEMMDGEVEGRITIRWARE